MKKHLELMLLLLIVGAGLRPVPTYAEEKGTTAAQFLKIGVGARPGALANAYTSLGDDVLSIFYNPGGLAFTEKAEVTAMHNEYFQDINLDFIGMSFPIHRRHTLGGGVQLLKTTDTQRSELLGIILSEFDIEDIAVTFSYAYLLNERVGLGINGKYIRETLYQHSASALAVDAGVLFRTPVEDLNIGLSFQNLGGQLKFIQVGDPLPLSLRFGISYRLFNRQLLLAADAYKYRQENPDASFGMEWNFKGLLQLRAGYRFSTDLDASDALTAGLGITYRDLSLDYAYVPFGDIGNSHRFSGNFKFGGVFQRDLSQPVPPVTYIAVAPETKVEIKTKQTGRVAIFKLTCLDDLAKSEVVEEDIKESLRVILSEGNAFTVIGDEEMKLKLTTAPESISLENACRLLNVDYVIFGGYKVTDEAAEVNLSVVNSAGRIRSAQVKSPLRTLVIELRKAIPKVF